MPKILEILSGRWKQYKYRFVPWMALNLKKRTVRTVESSSYDKVIPDGKVEHALLVLFANLHRHSGSPAGQKQCDLKGQSSRDQGKMNVKPRRSRSNVDYSGRSLHFWKDIFGQHRRVGENHIAANLSQVHNYPWQMCSFTHSLNHKDYHSNLEQRVPNQTSHKRFCAQATSKRIKIENRTFNSALQDTSSSRNFSQNDETNAIQCYKIRDPKTALEVMRGSLGFSIERRPSSIIGGGTGVFVAQGTVPADAVVAMYPGTVYAPWDPILFQSIANPFIFRCLDGTLIDGNDTGISRMVYRSCSQRDRMGPYLTSDLSWLTANPVNPMAVGQYVNNQNKANMANVAYQEFDVPESFPHHLLQYIPNVFYSSAYQENDSSNTRRMRTVVLVSLHKIQCGEELFSSYFTIVH